MYVIFFFSTSRSIIRDNFDALASRVHRWTRDDATRFLHTSFMAGPPPRNTQQLMDNARRMPATMLLRAIVGGNTYNRLTYEVWYAFLGGVHVLESLS